MNRVLCRSLLSISLIWILGCKSKTDDSQAIRDGIVKHINSLKGLDVNLMEITVVNSTIDGDRAQAQVEIRPKSEQAGTASMQLTYLLQKRGSDWVVVKSQAAGGTMEHPTSGVMPGGSMQGDQLPPGHPPVGGNAAGTTATHSNFSDLMRSTQPPANAPAQTAPPANAPPTNSPSTYTHP
jgi:hypothetical protein